MRSSFRLINLAIWVNQQHNLKLCMVSYLRDLDLAWGLDELPDLSFSGVLSQSPQNLSDLFNLQTKYIYMNEDFMMINLQNLAKCQLRTICVSCILCVYSTKCIWYMHACTVHMLNVLWINFFHCTILEIHLSSADGLSCKYCRSFQHSSQNRDAFTSLRPEAEFMNVQFRWGFWA